MLYSVIITTLLFNLILGIEGLRILLCFTVFAKSHSRLGHGFADHLLEAGHEVVHITSSPRGNLSPKLKEINVSSMEDDYRESPEYNEFMAIKNMVGKGNIMADTSQVVWFGYYYFLKLMEQSDVVEMLSDPNEKFDAVILEWYYSEFPVGAYYSVKNYMEDKCAWDKSALSPQPCEMLPKYVNVDYCACHIILVRIPALFEAPMIWFSPTEVHFQPLRLIDGISNPAYNVDVFSLYTPPLSFWERVEQLWTIIKSIFVTDFFIEPMQNSMYNDFYHEIATKRGVTIPAFKDALYNGSLMFINSHPSLGGAPTLPQNAINIAGYHIPDKIQPLPKRIQTIMDTAKNGVIYFSLGSSLKTDSMSQKMRDSFLNLFGRLKQTVIFKYESELDNIPANVYPIKWAPQHGILAHPNLRLFITHTGQMSRIEAIHYGVPIVGIPLYSDQFQSMNYLEKIGCAVRVTLAEDMADELETALKKVLTDETYKIRAKEVSSIYHDRPMKPGAALVYWVEYVVRTRGAPHLRSPALTVSLYQRLYLDLLALIFIAVVLFYNLIKYTLRVRTKNCKIKTKDE